jgi:hypothetical protein
MNGTNPPNIPKEILKLKDNMVQRVCGFNNFTSNPGIVPAFNVVSNENIYRALIVSPAIFLCIARRSG